MADARTLCRSDNERMQDFNKRLLATCQEMAVTKFDMEVVDGQPVVTLMVEEQEATQEDVDKDIAERQESKEAGEAVEGEPLALTDWIPVCEPLVVQIAKVGCKSYEAPLKPGERPTATKRETVDDAQRSEQRLAIIYERAKGGVVQMIMKSGPIQDWAMEPNNPAAKSVLITKNVTYAAVGYLNIPDSDEEDGDDDGEGQTATGGDKVEQGLARGGKRAPVGGGA